MWSCTQKVGVKYCDDIQMSQRGSCQGIECTTTGFALIALAVTLATIFTYIFAVTMLTTRMGRKVLFQTFIELTGLVRRLTKHRT